MTAKPGNSLLDREHSHQLQNDESVKADYGCGGTSAVENNDGYKTRSRSASLSNRPTDHVVEECSSAVFERGPRSRRTSKGSDNCSVDRSSQNASVCDFDSRSTRSIDAKLSIYQAVVHDNDRLDHFQTRSVDSVYKLNDSVTGYRSQSLSSVDANNSGRRVLRESSSRSAGSTPAHRIVVRLSKQRSGLLHCTTAKKHMRGANVEKITDGGHSGTSTSSRILNNSELVRKLRKYAATGALQCLPPPHTSPHRQRSVSCETEPVQNSLPPGLSEQCNRHTRSDNQLSTRNNMEDHESSVDANNRQDGGGDQGSIAALRPRRNIHPKKDEATGLSWREETDLNRALYASLQNGRSRYCSAAATNKTDLVDSISNRVNAKKTSLHRSNSSVDTCAQHRVSGSGFAASSRNSLDVNGGQREARGSGRPLSRTRSESQLIPLSRCSTQAAVSATSLYSFNHSASALSSAQDSTRSSSVVSFSVKSGGGGGEEKRKTMPGHIRAQRKFAHGSRPDSPCTSVHSRLANKCDVQQQPRRNLFPQKTIRTEDFLTFLCFRGTPFLPPELDFFNYSDAGSMASFPNTPQSSSDADASRPDTPDLCQSAENRSLLTGFGEMKLAVHQPLTTAKRQHEMEKSARFKLCKVDKTAGAVSNRLRKTTQNLVGKSLRTLSAANARNRFISTNSCHRRILSSSTGSPNASFHSSRSKTLTSLRRAVRPNTKCVTRKDDQSAVGSFRSEPYSTLRLRQTTAGMMLRTMRSRLVNSTDGRIVTSALSAEEESSVRRWRLRGGATGVTIEEGRIKLEERDSESTNEEEEEEEEGDSDVEEETSDVEAFLNRSGRRSVTSTHIEDISTRERLNVSGTTADVGLLTKTSKMAFSSAGTLPTFRGPLAATKASSAGSASSLSYGIVSSSTMDHRRQQHRSNNGPLSLPAVPQRPVFAQTKPKGVYSRSTMIVDHFSKLKTCGQTSGTGLNFTVQPVIGSVKEEQQKSNSVEILGHARKQLARQAVECKVVGKRHIKKDVGRSQSSVNAAVAGRPATRSVTATKMKEQLDRERGLMGSKKKRTTDMDIRERFIVVKRNRLPATSSDNKHTCVVGAAKPATIEISPDLPKTQTTSPKKLLKRRISSVAQKQIVRQMPPHKYSSQDLSTLIACDFNVKQSANAAGNVVSSKRRKYTANTLVLSHNGGNISSVITRGTVQCGSVCETPLSASLDGASLELSLDQNEDKESVESSRGHNLRRPLNATCQ